MAHGPTPHSAELPPGPTCGVLSAWPEARLTDRQVVPCQVHLICRRTSGTRALAQITFILIIPRSMNQELKQQKLTLQRIN